MRIIVSILFLTVFSFALSGQSGNGTSASPFYGTINNSVTWNVGNPDYGSTVYVGTSGNPDLTIDSNGHLTIEPGITVIFTQESSDLIITGSGIITAEGTQSDSILFTKASGNDHRGHISFETPGTDDPITGTGSFKFCIISHGFVSTAGINPDNFAGGIQINADNVVIENCSFLSNYGYYGGAIAIHFNKSVTIRNCHFFNNSSRRAGAGIFIRQFAYADVENCLFENNSCNRALGNYSGGAVWMQQSTSKIINCTFVENTSNLPGDAFYSYSSSGASIINSIFWGSSDQADGAIVSTTFTNCAFESVKPSEASNSIVISDVADDHFIDAGSGNWSLKYKSPCRDAGITPDPAIPYDFAGIPRIGPTDIGALECQYSRWTGSTSTSWTTASNWEADIDPSTGTGDVVIPSGLSNYPVNASNPDFTIGSDNVMILEPGTRATLNNLTNNGSLTMEADASGLSSLIMTSYTKGGTATEDIQLYLTGGYVGDPEYNEGRWHYISTPVTNFSKSIFTANTNDLAQWVDGMQSAGSLRDGWVAHDGYIYYVSDPEVPSTWTGPTFNTLTLGKGYNFWDNLASYTYSISGQLNTGNVNASLSFAGAEYENGFNLLGNPFTSGLDWDYIVENTVFPDNTSKGIFFTKEGQQYSYISGVLVPDHGIPAPSGVIPPMQGFFVKTYSTGNSINLTSAARTHNDIPARYKGSSPIPLVRLGLTDDISTDETVVRFAEKALAGIDMDYDAPKMYNPGKSSIFTIIPGKKMAVNGIPFLEPETFIEIPVSVNIKSSGNHTINAIQIQEIADYDVFLTDNTTGYTADLKTSPKLTFSSSTGLIEGRFILKISNVTTGIEDPSATSKPFSIYHWSEFINIQTLSDTWDGKNGEVKVYNLAGKTISENRSAEFFRDSMIRIPAPASKGLYIVEIKSGPLKHVGKVIIN
ncbi:MAG TPA: T9SS type A sorting domain-containing protein [Bacteroidales bacterium]|nr:T9SS type A sorting domain-containing protein [Bacteroidales bacterium]